MEIEALIFFIVTLGLTGAFFLELLPFYIKSGAFIVDLPVYGAAFQSFVSLLGRVFLLLITPIVGIGLELGIISETEIINGFLVGYFFIIFVFIIITIFRMFLINFLSSYIKLSLSRNSYFTFPRKIDQHHNKNIIFSSNLSIKDKAFFIGNIISAMFSICMLPIIISLASTYSEFRLSIYSLAPLVTFFGTFCNQYYVERILSVYVQNHLSPLEVEFEFLAGRFVGYSLSVLIFVGIFL